MAFNACITSTGKALKWNLALEALGCNKDWYVPFSFFGKWHI